MDFNYSDSEMKVPIVDPGERRTPDIGKIESFIEKKRNKYAYTEDPDPSCSYDSFGAGCDAEAKHTATFLQYELPLCEHHLNKFQKELCEREIRCD
jgi:hypothetical protein